MRAPCFGANTQRAATNAARVGDGVSMRTDNVGLDSFGKAAEMSFGVHLKLKQVSGW